VGPTAANTSLVNHDCVVAAVGVFLQNTSQQSLVVVERGGVLPLLLPWSRRRQQHQAKATAKERKRGWMWIFLSVNPDDICVSIADSVPLTHSRRRRLFFALSSRARVSVIYALVLRANLSSQTTTPNKNTHTNVDLTKRKSRLTEDVGCFARRPCCLLAPKIKNT
jgi:hypothetical protein